MYNLDLDFYDFLCEIFEIDLDKNEQLVNSIKKTLYKVTRWKISIQKL
jgi:hypothetical protein